MSRVHERSVGDLLLDVLVLVVGERAAQAHVHDDAHRPHVQRAVVAAAVDDLRRQVGGRAHDGATERLLADDPREAEVAQLHLAESGLLTVRLLRQGDTSRRNEKAHTPEGKGPQRPAARSQVSGHSGRCV